ncbi:MAG: hypothetical protein F6K35_41825 [Okeania sp. SIO2H7]|nr:hypothetical protein [Okeania sp. SIO2H7]
MVAIAKGDLDFLSLKRLLGTSLCFVIQIKEKLNLDVDRDFTFYFNRDRRFLNPDSNFICLG